MCTPAAFIGLQIAQSSAQFLGETQAAREQVAFQEELGKKTAQRANQAFSNEASQIGRRLEQQREAAAERRQEATRSAAQVRARAALAAGEAGVGGQSVAALQQDIERQEGLAQTRISRNIGFAEEQAVAEIEGARIRALNRRLTPQPVQFPGLLASGLTIGSRVAEFRILQERTD